jgi:hypothetical protein
MIELESKLNLISKLNNSNVIAKNNIGKRALFAHTITPNGKIYSFSSTIENIGIVFDRSLANYTEVIIFSDECAAYHPLFGHLYVMKVFHLDTMWIPNVSLHIIDE